MTNKEAGGGVSACGLLGVAFVVLKLCKVIDWSWWWVLCPFWAPLAILLLCVLGAVIQGVARGIRRFK